MVTCLPLLYMFLFPMNFSPALCLCFYHHCNKPLSSSSSLHISTATIIFSSPLTLLISSISFEISIIYLYLCLCLHSTIYFLMSHASLYEIIFHIHCPVPILTPSSSYASPTYFIILNICFCSHCTLFQYHKPEYIVPLLQ